VQIVVQRTRVDSRQAGNALITTIADLLRGSSRGEHAIDLFRRQEEPMSVHELWWLSLAIFAAVIVVVAVLLGLIIAAAKRVDQQAAAISLAGKQIAGNTVSIWMLEKTNEHLEQTRTSARSLERSAASMAETLRALGGGPAAAGSPRGERG
jgi:hypothetical protein